jgi:hypothetical protein
MATKGEKIVTILCGALVQPNNAGDWPTQFGHVSKLPSGESIRPNAATVQAVFLVDGHVMLLVQNITDGKLAEVPAHMWKVERNP